MDSIGVHRSDPQSGIGNPAVRGLRFQESDGLHRSPQIGPAEQDRQFRTPPPRRAASEGKLSGDL